MKLTKIQRHTAYIIMRAEFEADKLDFYASDGYCYLLRNTLGLYDSKSGYDDIIKEYLPELQKRKPKHLYNSKVGLWFPSNSIGGLQQRIALLDQCIEETYC